MLQFCARAMAPAAWAPFQPPEAKRVPFLANSPATPIPNFFNLFFSFIFSPPIDGARGVSDPYLHQKPTVVLILAIAPFSDSPTTPSLSIMSAMERTKSESEVSMKDVDEVDEYEEVKATRSR